MSCIKANIFKPYDGCISVNLKKVPDIGIINITDNYNHCKVDLTSKNSNINLDLFSNQKCEIDFSNKNKANISIGLVCGVDLGVLILCSAEGDLITIDGHYLTISRHAKISS